MVFIYSFWFCKFCAFVFCSCFVVAAYGKVFQTLKNQTHHLQ